MPGLPATVILSLVTLGFSFGGDIHVPAGFNGRIAHTSFGGNVDVARAPRGAQIRSFGGEVRIGATQGNLVVSSFGGNVEVDSLGGDARLSSFGGAVDVSLVDQGSTAARKIVLRSFGGDVRLNIPSDFDATVEVHASCRKSREGHCGVAASDLDFRETRSSSRSLFRRRQVIDSRATMGDGRHRVIVRLEDSRIVVHRIGHKAT